MASLKVNSTFLQVTYSQRQTLFFLRGMNAQPVLYFLPRGEGQAAYRKLQKAKGTLAPVSQPREGVGGGGTATVARATSGPLLDPEASPSSGQHPG